MKEKLNNTSLDTIAAALCYAMGIEAPELAHEKNEELTDLLQPWKNLSGSGHGLFPVPDY